MQEWSLAIGQNLLHLWQTEFTCISVIENHLHSLQGDESDNVNVKSRNQKGGLSI